MESIQIITRTCSFCWSLTKWCVALAIIAVIGVGAYWWFELDNEIRSQVELTLENHYGPLGLDVKVGTAELVEGEGIRIRDISIVDTYQAGNHPKLIEIKEIFLTGDIEIQDLINGSPRLKQVKVSGAKIYATRRDDGTWSTARLIPLPKFSKETETTQSPVEIVIEDSEAEIFDPNKSSDTATSIRRISMRLSPKKQTEPKTTIGRWYDVIGEFNCQHFRAVNIKGEFNGDTRQWNIAGRLDSLEVSSRLKQAIPHEYSEYLTLLDYVEGQTSIDYQVSHDPKRKQPYQFRVDGKLTNCRLNDPRLPYPITDVQAEFQCNHQGYVVPKLQARIGSGQINFACQGAGYRKDSPLKVALELKSFVLDEKYVALLPDSAQLLWHKFSPMGMIDANVNVNYDGRDWKNEGKITCRGTSFSYHRLPYQLDQTTGTVELKNNVLETNLTSYAGHQPVKITSKLFNPGPHFTAWTEIQCSNIPIDKKLLNAAPEKTRKLLVEFKAGGKFDFHGRFEKNDKNSAYVKKHAYFKLKKCNVNYDKFPYPFRDIEGLVEMKDKNLIFRNLKTDQITCNGYWDHDRDGGRLDLFFDAVNAPIDQKLFLAVPEKVRQQMIRLRIDGILDQLKVDLHYTKNNKKVQTEVIAKEFPNKTNQPRQSISIQPDYFSYRMDDVTGIVTYKAGKIELQQFKASHGKTKIAAAGECTHQANGSWQIALRQIQVDNLKLDRDYLSALPEKAGKALGELNLDLPISIRGRVNFQGSSDPKIHTTSNWDLTAYLQQASIDAGVKLSNIHGALRIIGGVDRNNKHRSLGLVDFDSITFKDFQFTEVQGPFEIRDDKLFIGSQAERLGQNKKPQPLTGKSLGGYILADCAVAMGSVSAFNLQAQLVDADLRKIARQEIAGKQKLSGRVLADIKITGNSRGNHTLRGNGRIRLRDANIYELPVMVSMLKLLSVRLPDSKGFTSSDIDYRISGQHIYFDRINFNGDAFSLLGKGEMDMDKKIKLYFYTVLGSDKLRIPILRPLLGETSQQIMQIKIDGTLSNPKTTREAFPAAKKLLQQLQTELNISPKAASSSSNNSNNQRR